MTLSAPLSPSHQLRAGDRVFIRFNASFGGQTIASALNRLGSYLGTVRLGSYLLEGFPVWDPQAQTINVIVRVTGTPLHLIVAGIIAAAVVGAAIVLTLREARLIVSEQTQQQLLSQCDQLQAQGRFAEAERCRQQAAGAPEDFMAKHWPLLFLGLGLGVLVFVRLTE